jgi:hypothetical protein
MSETNEQQRHFNEWPISELHGHGEVGSIKLLLIALAIIECRLGLSAQVEGAGRSDNSC